MRPDIFPNYRHLVVTRAGHRFPARITKETPLFFETPVGLFAKATHRKWDDREVTCEGPFTAEGDMEGRP